MLRRRSTTPPRIHSPAMARSIAHLVRHGEVHNPGHIVYASLPGFGLSTRGRKQATRAAEYLAEREIALIASSPLERAQETAGIIATRLRLPIVTDERLTEWALGEHWSGVAWDELPDRFPGELDAYLEHPESLDFSPESLDDLADRVGKVVRELVDGLEGDAVFVSHQDPIQASRLAMTCRSLRMLQSNKPGHSSVVSLSRSGDAWAETSYWEPPQGPGFPPVEKS